LCFLLVFSKTGQALEGFSHGTTLRGRQACLSLGVKNRPQFGRRSFAIKGDEAKPLIIWFIPCHVPECGQSESMNAMSGYKLFDRFNQLASDTAPLPIPMDCNLPDMQGASHHLPVQEPDNAMTLQLCGQSNAICDQGAMLFLRLNIIVRNPFQSRPLPEYFTGTTLDLWQKRHVLIGCRSDVCHISLPVG
jgi:hypothetical protein